LILSIAFSSSCRDGASRQPSGYDRATIKGARRMRARVGAVAAARRNRGAGRRVDPAIPFFPARRSAAMTQPTDTPDNAGKAPRKDGSQPAPRGVEPVEDRPNVGTTTPEAYPDTNDAGAGSGGGGKPDYGSPKR
jgi:hypothetical protein